MNYDDDISTVMTENGIDSHSASVAMDDGFYKGFEQFMGAEPPKLARLAENEKDYDNNNRKKSNKNKGKKNKNTKDNIMSSLSNTKNKNNNNNNKSDVSSVSSSILNNNSHVKSKIDTGRNIKNNKSSKSGGVTGGATLDMALVEEAFNYKPASVPDLATMLNNNYNSGSNNINMNSINLSQLNLDANSSGMFRSNNNGHNNNDNDNNNGLGMMLNDYLMQDDVYDETINNNNNNNSKNTNVHYNTYNDDWHAEHESKFQANSNRTLLEQTVDDFLPHKRGGIGGKIPEFKPIRTEKPKDIRIVPPINKSKNNVYTNSSSSSSSNSNSVVKSKKKLMNLRSNDSSGSTSRGNSGGSGSSGSHGLHQHSHSSGSMSSIHAQAPAKLRQKVAQMKSKYNSNGATGGNFFVSTESTDNSLSSKINSVDYSALVQNFSEGIMLRQLQMELQKSRMAEEASKQAIRGIFTGAQGSQQRSSGGGLYR